MPTVTIAVDLAKNVFELAIASRPGVTPKRRRLSRPQFGTFWAEQAPCRVIMEACSSAHYWARHSDHSGLRRHPATTPVRDALPSSQQDRSCRL